MSRVAFGSVEEVERALASASYLPDRGLATAVYLALAMRRPLLLEGEAGVGKTEVAKTLARILGAELIRLQCYEGIDASQALYEWDYARQLLYARSLQAGETAPRPSGSGSSTGRTSSPSGRSCARSAPAPAAVLLIDELDRADDEFEAFLLEVLSDFQVTVPELGTIAADGAARRRDHVEPDARAARRAQAPLPLPLDRLPRPRARGRDHPAARARRLGGARALGRRGGRRGCASSTSSSGPGAAEAIDWAQALALLGAESVDGDARRARRSAGR